MIALNSISKSTHFELHQLHLKTSYRQPANYGATVCLAKQWNNFVLLLSNNYNILVEIVFKCYNFLLLSSWGMRLETNKYYLLFRQSMSERWIYTRIITAFGGRIVAAASLKYANFNRNRIRITTRILLTHPLTYPLTHKYTCPHIIIGFSGSCGYE